MRTPKPFEFVGIVVAFVTFACVTVHSQSLFRQNSHTTTPLYSIYFDGGQLGVAIGANARNVATSDEGRNWVPGIIDPNFTGNFYCCVLNDDSNQAYAGDSGRIYTVLSAHPPRTITLPETKSIYGMTFSTYDTAVVVGAGGLIYKSNDSGKTWSKIKPPAFVQNRDFHGVTYFDDSTYWVVGSGGVVLYTEDAGTTWQRIAVNTTRDLYAICFPDTSRNGWIVGDRTLLYTTDAGDTWISVPTDADLRCVFGYDGLHAYAAGLNGILLATNDEKTWTPIPTGTTANLYSLDIPDSLFVCGDSGVILSSIAPINSTVSGRLTGGSKNVMVMSGTRSAVIRIPEENGSAVRFRITNMLGIDVYCGEYDVGGSINFTDLPLGAYFYAASSGNTSVRGKFILR